MRLLANPTWGKRIHEVSIPQVKEVNVELENWIYSVSFGGDHFPMAEGASLATASYPSSRQD
jgi:hypothetical protein